MTSTAAPICFRPGCVQPATQEDPRGRLWCIVHLPLPSHYYDRAVAAEAKLARYEAALHKAVDTFREFEKAFTILRRPAVAEAAKIAADWTEQALEEKE